MHGRAILICIAMSLVAGAACADVLKRADGGRYVGQVVDGKAEGQGVETRPDGTLLKGRFVKDVFVEGTMRSDGWVVPFSSCHSIGAAALPQAAQK
jgi:hypothetical protein